MLAKIRILIRHNVVPSLSNAMRGEGLRKLWPDWDAADAVLENFHSVTEAILIEKDVYL